MGTWFDTRPGVDDRIVAIARRLSEVRGVAGVTLGGSRARGTHLPGSDVDLGVYYRAPLDLTGLRELAREVTGRETEVTEPGAWGPWVDGGGWLDVDGQRVDWIYRDLDRVRRVWDDCLAGRSTVSFQVGHPLGFSSHAYAGELALGQVLADPTGELAALQEATRRYPEALGAALVRGIWEASFLVGVARKSLARGDTAWLAGCLFRVVGILVHALHGRAGRWVTTEKGAVAAAGSLPGAPPGFAERVDRLLGAVGTTPDEHAATLDEAEALTAAVVEATR
jgi:predicted nucleotidyltransferase